MSTKLWSCGVGILAVAGLGVYMLVAGSSPRVAATCTGAADCHACKTCNYCGHCAKQGGTCGVKDGKARVAVATAGKDECCDK